MIHMLLFILKIIGIILLSILGILLLIALLVVFVPIRYRAAAKLKAGEINANVQVTWLLHMVSATASYQEGFHFALRLFGILIFDEGTKAKRAAKTKRGKRNVKKLADKKDKTKREVKREQAEETAKEALRDLMLEPAKEEAGELTAEPIKEEIREQTGVPVKEDIADNPEGMNGAAGEEDLQERRSLWRKIRSFFDMIAGGIRSILKKCQNIKYTIGKICVKIEKVKARLGYYTDLFQSDLWKLTYKLCKKQLLTLWRNIKPDRYQVYLRVGTGEPASTGQIMAYYGMFYPFYGSHVQLCPEFDNVVLEGNVFLKGGLTVFVLLKIAWILYFDKNLRKFLALLKKEAV